MAIAFPSAQGYGTDTPGGLGGKILRVTNGNDDGSPGSFRWAVKEPYPRIVVFEYAGVITLNTPLSINQPYCTIAGYLAPPGGVTLRGEELRFRSHDIVIRHMRHHAGHIVPAQDTFDDRDCMNTDGGSGIHHIVVDHCDLLWSVDECFAAWGGAQYMTISDTLIGEPLWHSVHPKTVGPPFKGHSMGLVISSADPLNPTKYVSVIRTAVANSNQRNIQIDNADFVDVRNLYVYNYGNFGTAEPGAPFEFEGIADKQINLVGAVYDPGPNSYPLHPGIVILANNANGKLFIDQCRGPCDGVLNSGGAPGFNQWNFVRLGNGTVPPETGHRLDAPFAAPEVRMTDPDKLKDCILANCGATKPGRDSHNQRIMDQIRNNTGAIIDDETTVGGF